MWDGGRSGGFLARGVVRSARQSPVALLALVVALGGTAWAASKAGPSDIANNAIRSQHLAAKQVKMPEVNSKSLGSMFGAGVLGGMVTEFSLESQSSSGGEAIAVVGHGIQPNEDFDFAVPRRTTIRDLHVRIAGGDVVPNGRSVRFFLSRIGGPGGIIDCTIPSGKSRCNSGGQLLVLKPGNRLSAFIEAFGAAVEVPEMTYLFGYREGP